MELEYLREGSVNYLRYPIKEKADYRIEMITRNYLGRILPMELRRVDEWEWVYCKISGLISLSQCLEKGRIGERELNGFFHSVEELCHNMEEYLLPFEGLLLEPEFIYVKPDEMQHYYWIYGNYGNEKGTFDAEDLLGYLMDRLDYGNQRVVKLLYSVYQVCRGNEGDIEVIRNAYQSVMEKEKREQEVSYLEPALVESAYLKTAEEGQLTQQIYHEKNGILNKIKESCVPVLKRLGKLQEKEARKGLGNVLEKEKLKRVRNLYEEEKEEGRKKEGKEKQKQEKVWKEVIVEAKTEKQEEATGTTLLTGGMMAGGIYCLKAKNLGYSDMLLTSYPFFIGKDETKMDGIVEDAFVSRYHARIDREETCFRVLDLGSTNGTFVNRERLNPYEARVIQEGDILGFAHREYEFCFLS